MDNGSKPEIPSIVTEDLSSTPVIHVDHPEEFVSPAFPAPSACHSTENSDPFLLSPGPQKSGRRSIDTNADEDGLSVIPPSPTLSTQSSVHFNTSTVLRDNKPGDGTTSLALLSPKDPSRSHSRRPSNATMTSTDEGTVADHSPGTSHLYPATSNATTSARSAVETLNSPTPTHVGSTSDIGEFEHRMRDHQKPRKKAGSSDRAVGEEGGDDKDDGDKTIHLDLAQDTHIDPTPFTFRPYHLAFLVDPKNLDVLQTMGGTTGLLEGLGVNAMSGLRIVGRPPQPGEPPSVVVTNPDGEKGESYESPAFGGTVEDRQRVYGSNVLPVRRTRTLLQLMWIALKDRVLVRLIRFFCLRLY
jgi:P-type Ca2+ transporter type 2C